MDLKKRYAKSSKKVREAMYNIIDNNQIEQNFIPILDLIHQNYEILYDSIDSIAKNGDTDDSEKRLKKKTDIHTYFTAMQNIIKLLQNFPSSPLSKAKIKKLNQNDTSDDEPDCLKEFFNN